MSIKVRALNKYYIKQYIINNKSFQEWSTVDFPEIDKDSKIIGYLFCNQIVKGFHEPTMILNMYLIKKAGYQKEGVSLEKLARDWKLFLLLDKVKENTYVYVNPPLDTWMNTKMNWCKKIATKVSNKFKIEYNDALSDVFLAIAKVYERGDVYIGSLNYIEKSVFNDIMCTYRYNRIRVNQDSGLAISMNTPIGLDADGKEVTIGDTLAEPEYEDEESIGYQSTLKCCKELMKDRFSPREIDQIIQFNGSETILPFSLYRKLWDWRQKHSPKEVLHNEKN